MVITGAPDATIGGTTAGARNVVSGNTVQGIIIQGDGSTDGGATIQGNYVGTNAAGTAAIPNGQPLGEIGAIDILGFPNVTIGGTTAGARNVVSGNATINIRIFHSTATGAVIQGNYIGTNAAGTAALSSQVGVTGVAVVGAPNATIGGTADGAGNWSRATVRTASSSTIPGPRAP